METRGIINAVASTLADGGVCAFASPVAIRSRRLNQKGKRPLMIPDMFSKRQIK